MSDALLILIFLAAAAVSLSTGWLLVSRLERIGARLGLSEALLGLLAALAADVPEITAAISALISHRAQTGAGVAIGSNVFNLAALLGLSALVAGRIALHRRVILLEGTISVTLAVTTLMVMTGVVAAGAGLGLALAVLLPYIIVLGVGRDRLGRLRLPPSWTRWLARAVGEEEMELEVAIHPQPGRLADVVVAAASVLVVLAASVVLERTASEFGSRHSIPEIVVGGLILAAVTSLPNAVAAIYLARRGRGAATLSTAMNSNALNVAVGLMLPGTILGLGSASVGTRLVGAWYTGLTVLALVGAYRSRGLRRGQGVLIIASYLAFAGLLIATA